MRSETLFLSFFLALVTVGAGVAEHVPLEHMDFEQEVPFFKPRLAINRHNKQHNLFFRLIDITYKVVCVIFYLCYNTYMNRCPLNHRRPNMIFGRIGHVDDINKYMFI